VEDSDAHDDEAAGHYDDANGWPPAAKAAAARNSFLNQGGRNLL
jgi:hypothetical protein